MHTFEGKSVRIFHDGDFSGKAIIFDKNKEIELEVDMKDLIDLVAEKIRSDKIGVLEQMSSEEILSSI